MKKVCLWTIGMLICTCFIACGPTSTSDACTKDADCKGDRICSSGQCKESQKTDACTKDSDCKGDRICSSGQCTDSQKADTCTKDSDCKGDRVCKSGKCENNAAVDKKGFTKCGAITCRPNQYCNPNIERCNLGCLSDLNCTDNQVCTKRKGSDSGECTNKTTPPPKPKDMLKYCVSGCNILQKCELFTMTETSQCHSDCSRLNDSQRKAFGDCADMWKLCTTGIPGCLSGIECGGKHKCPDGQECIDHSCI